MKKIITLTPCSSMRVSEKTVITENEKRDEKRRNFCSVRYRRVITTQ